MEPKKMILAVLVGYLLMGTLSYLVRGIWLIPIYSHYELIWRLRGMMMPHFWVMWLGQLLFIVMFVWIYIRGVDSKPWVKQGLRYGLMMTLLTVVPAACTQYVIYPIPYTLLGKWIAAGGVQLVLLGLVVASFCRKPVA